MFVGLPYVLGWDEQPTILLGASAGVLGLVGVTAAILTKLYWTDRNKAILSQLWSVVQILILQFLFDTMVPEVSSAAHIGGAITGYFLGLAIPNKLRVVKR